MVGSLGDKPNVYPLKSLLSLYTLFSPPSHLGVSIVNQKKWNSYYKRRRQCLNSSQSSEHCAKECQFSLRNTTLTELHHLWDIIYVKSLWMRRNEKWKGSISPKFPQYHLSEPQLWTFRNGIKLHSRNIQTIITPKTLPNENDYFSRGCSMIFKTKSCSKLNIYFQF